VTHITRQASVTQQVTGLPATQRKIQLSTKINDC